MYLLVPVSYMGSGSSALTDLLAEYEGVLAPHNDFEYVFLHCPDGLFDLEDKLLHGNTALRSDEALHSFSQRMQNLNKSRWWVADYQTKIGPHFASACQQFIANLIDAKPDFYWYEQEQNEAWMYPALIFNKLLRFLSRGKIQRRRPLTHPEIWLSWPSADEFYAKARQFLAAVFEPIAAQYPKQKHLVFDQLLLPHNLHRLEHYFPLSEKTYTPETENGKVAPAEDSPLKLKALVINRDPRDVFISNKYFWSKQNVPLPYPTDVQDFCRMYRKLRQAEKPAVAEGILRLQFEDLIYNYEKTCARIESFLDLCPEQHHQALTRFNPQRSIQNTQLFLAKSDWQNEAEVIHRELTEYCYDFPYTYINKDRQVF